MDLTKILFLGGQTMNKLKIPFSLAIAAFLLMTGCSGGGSKKKDESKDQSDVSSSESGGGGEGSKDTSSSEEEKDTVEKKALEAYATACENFLTYDGSYYVEDTMFEEMEEETLQITVDSESGKMAYVGSDRERLFVPGENDVGTYYVNDKKYPSDSYKRNASNSYGKQKYKLIDNCSEMVGMFVATPLYCGNEEDTLALYKIINEMMASEVFYEMNMVYSTGEKEVKFAEKEAGLYSVEINFDYSYVTPEAEYPNGAIIFVLEFEFTKDFIFYMACTYNMSFNMSAKSAMSATMSEEIHIQNEFNEEFFNKTKETCQQDSFDEDGPLLNNISLVYKDTVLTSLYFEPNETISMDKLNLQIPNDVTLKGVYTDPELKNAYTESKSVDYSQKLYVELTPKAGYSLLLSKYIVERSFPQLDFTARELEILEEIFHFTETSTQIQVLSTASDAKLPWSMVEGGVKILSAKLDGVEYNASFADLSSAAEHEFVMTTQLEAGYSGVSISSAARFEHIGIANDGDGLLVRAFTNKMVYFSIDVKDIQKEGFELKYSDFASDYLLDENGIGASTPLTKDSLDVSFYNEDGDEITEVPAEGRIVIYVNYTGSAQFHYVLIG